MGEDIRVKIGADVSGVKKSLNKVLASVSVPALKQRRLKKSGIVESSSRVAGGRSLPGLSSVQQKQPTSKLDTGIMASLGKTFHGALLKYGKKNKEDLQWKWLKGTYNVLAKYSPLMKSFMQIFDAAMALLTTGILLPFLDDIIGFLKWLLEASVGFFKWMKDNKEAVKTTATDALKVTIDLAFLSKEFRKWLWNLIPETWKARILKVIGVLEIFWSKLVWIKDEVVKLAMKFGPLKTIITSVTAWLGKTGLEGALTKIVGFIARVINPLMWANLIFALLEGIFSMVLGPDNPLTIFVGLCEDMTDVIGLVIDALKDFLSVFGIGEGGNVAKRMEELGKKASEAGKAIFEPMGLKEGWMRDIMNQLSGPVDAQIAPEDLHAEGGIFNKPTLGVIGEAGPEAVIPLDKMGGMGTTNITVSGLVDEQKFRAIIKEEIAKAGRGLYNVRGSVGI